MRMVMSSIEPNGSCICRSSGTHLVTLIVERQLAAVAELHDGYRGEGLGDRGPMEDGAFAHGFVALAVGVTILVMSQHSPVPHDQRTATHDAVTRGKGVEPGSERGPTRWRGSWLGLALRGERGRRRERNGGEGRHGSVRSHGTQSIAPC